MSKRLNLATALLLFPFLTPEPKPLAALLGRYEERRAADSAVALLRQARSSGGAERAIIEFLLANDLEGLGLLDEALRRFQAASRSAAIAPAAALGAVRVRFEAGEDDALYHEARSLPWDRFVDDDFAEAAYRVAGACFRSGRYPEARSWLSEVPRASPFFPFARYLLAQTEYAIGRYGEAVEAAEPVFALRRDDVVERLQERTAVLLGDMFVEIGLYDDAVAIFGWPDRTSPFHRRALRDAAVARALAQAEGGWFDRAAWSTSSVNRALEAIEQEVADSVDDPSKVAARAAELRRAWPSRRLDRARRAWAARRATAAVVAEDGWTVRRVFDAAWQSLPPVILVRFFQRGSEHAPAAAPSMAAEDRFFFAPDPAVARVLAAAALVAEPAQPGCDGAAATALRTRAAAALLGEEAAPTSDDIGRIGAGCGEGTLRGVAERAEAELAAAVSADARRIQRELRRRRYALEEAMARASLDRETAAQAERSAR